MGGVTSHSSTVGQDSYCIFACNGKETEFLKWAQDVDLRFKKVVGKWQGKEEPAFIINTKTLDLWLNFFKPSTGGWLEGQECVLVLGPCDARDKRPANLVYEDGRTEYQGLFQSITAKEAATRDDWMFDPSTNIHFACK